MKSSRRTWRCVALALRPVLLRVFADLGSSLGASKMRSVSRPTTRDPATKDIILPTQALQDMTQSVDSVGEPGSDNVTIVHGRKPPSMVVLPAGSFLINNLRRMQQHPDVVRLKLGIRDFYLVNAPSMIQEVLVTKQRDFIKGEFLQNTKKVFGEGLLTSEGDLHHKQRRLIQPAFHHDRIKAYAETIIRYEERITKNWRDGDILDIHEEMTRLTMEIIAKCLFDIDVGSRSESISGDLTLMIEYFDRLSSAFSGLLERLPSNKKYQRAVARVDSFVRDMIKERRASPGDRGDLMSMLLSAKDEDGSTMSDSQIRDEVLITFAAGHETTSNALTWTWYLLSQNPDVEKKLHDEVDSVLNIGQPPMVKDIPKLEYTNKVITESMRIYPPAWVLPREALRDVVIGGYLVPKGSNLLVSQYVNHHNPLFFADPETFNPDRWTPDMRSRLPKFAYFPFGGGARSCVGEPFAWMEGVLLIAAIARSWEMHHARGHKVELSPNITLRPKHGMMMELRARRSYFA